MRRRRASLTSTLADIPDGARVVIDGLAMGGLPEPVQGRACPSPGFLSLVHLPLVDETGLDAPRRARYTARERDALAACVGVLATSEFMARRLEAFGVEPSRVRTVPPGTDPARPAVGPGSDAPPMLLCVASLIPRKGQDVLMHALSRVQALRWTCVCAGSLDRVPGYATLVRELTRKTGLAGRVRFLGECESDRLDDLYHHASLLVLPSHYESYGMVLAEALARGLPVVSTTGGAIPLTVPGDASVLVPPGDDAALAEALHGLLAGRGRCQTPRRVGERRSAPRAEVAQLDAGRSRVCPGDARSDTRWKTFDADWLALREPVDHRSRDEGLLVPLSDAWRAHGWARVLDLGTGTGSNLRYLTTRLPSGQEWVAVDHDSALLAVLGRAVTPTSLRSLTLVSGDLAHEGLAAIPDADLVTASALLDLVSEDWLRRLVDACVAADRAAYFALSYDGEIRWWGGAEPGGSGEADPDDALVRDAVNVHQTGEKALGPGLGPTAGRCAERLFRTAGYVTRQVQSPWQLGAATARSHIG